MIHSTGSSTTTQSARGLLNNIPSCVAGWFRGKFATIATKIKCLLSGAGRTHTARQAERTSLDARRVSSDSQEQGYSSVVMPSGSRVSKHDLPVLNGAVLQHAYVEVLGPVAQKITEIVEDLKTKASSVIETCHLEANSVDQLRAEYNVNRSRLLVERIDLNESFINERDDCIKLLKDIMVKQQEEFVKKLEWLNHLCSVHINKADEICGFGKEQALKYVDGSKLVGEKDVRLLQRNVMWFHLVLNDLNKQPTITGLIVSDGNLEKKLSDIKKVLDPLMQVLKMNP